MKKCISVLLIIVMIASLTACERNNLKGIYKGGETNSEYYAFDGDNTFAKLNSDDLSEMMFSGTYEKDGDSIHIISIDSDDDCASEVYEQLFSSYRIIFNSDVNVVSFHNKETNIGENYSFIGEWKNNKLPDTPNNNKTSEKQSLYGTYKYKDNYYQLNADGTMKYAFYVNNNLRLDNSTFSMKTPDTMEIVNMFNHSNYEKEDTLYIESLLNGSLKLFYYIESEDTLYLRNPSDSATAQYLLPCEKISADEFPTENMNLDANNQDEQISDDTKEIETRKGEYIGKPKDSNNLDDIEEWFRSTDIDFYWESEFVTFGTDEIGDFAFYGLDATNPDFGYYIYPSIGKIIFVNRASNIERIEMENYTLTYPRNTM